MPEFLAPGVYVEETSFRARSIEGVATTTALFLGIAAGSAKPDLVSPLLTSLRDLTDAWPDASGLLADAAAAFFDNAGKRLHLVSAAPGGWESALAATIPLTDVAIVAAPGLPEAAPALIAHAEAQARFAIVDSPSGLDSAGIRAFRAGFDTSHAALYHPWIVTASGLQPPSGFVAGICARTDIERGVYKAPANEIVRGAIGLESPLDHQDRETFNDLGINPIAHFTDRGIRVWGARTMASDPEWKYVSVRRLFLYLERSIERGIHWAVFEPNTERLWASVAQTVGDFLYRCWQEGALLGAKPEHAYFVRCDRSTMTQNDIDNGRLIVEIGVAPIQPAEFMIFRISVVTGSAT